MFSSFMILLAVFGAGIGFRRVLAKPQYPASHFKWIFGGINLVYFLYF